METTPRPSDSPRTLSHNELTTLEDWLMKAYQYYNGNMPVGILITAVSTLRRVHLSEQK